MAAYSDKGAPSPKDFTADWLLELAVQEDTEGTDIFQAFDDDFVGADPRSAC